MRRIRVRAHRLWVGVLVGVVGLGSGCKRQESPSTGPTAAGDAGVSSPAASAPASRDAGVAVKPNEALGYSDVKLSHTGELFKLSYLLTNQGQTRVRGFTCMRVHDEMGDVIDDFTLGPISLRGGESDVFTEEGKIKETLWKQVRSIQLFASKSSCITVASYMISPLFHVDMAGRPVAAGTPPPRENEGTAAGTLELSTKDMTQNEDSNTVTLTYTVKNTGARRANGSVCLRAYQSAGASSPLEQALLGDFSLPAGGSETFTEDVTFDNDENWDTATALVASASHFGCADSLDEATSNLVRFEKPEGIHAPPQSQHDDHDHDDQGPNSNDQEPSEEDTEKSTEESTQ